MDALLSEMIEAHGGLDRWSGVDRLAARLTIGGPFWEAKGQPGAGGRKTVEADTRQERLGLTPFAAADWDLEFSVDPEHVAVVQESIAFHLHQTGSKTEALNTPSSQSCDMRPLLSTAHR